MKLSALKVLELNDEHNLIGNLCDRSLNNPEGVAIDLRVGKVERIISDSFLGADGASRERYSSKTELVGDVEIDGNKAITMRPGEYYLVSTMEVISSPEYKVKFDDGFPEAYLIPKILPRSSLQRGGVSLHVAATDPGYSGPLVFGMCNLGDQDFTFDLGARMFIVEYEVVVGDIKRTYTGQHQGGRVTSQGEKETQN